MEERTHLRPGRKEKGRRGSASRGSRECRLHCSSTTSRQALAHLWSPVLAMLDHEERPAVTIPKSRLTGEDPAVSPKGRELTASEVPRTTLHLRLLLLCLKRTGFKLFPVRAHSSQKYLHSNKSHLCKHQRLSQVHVLYGFQSPLLLLSGCQGVMSTQRDGL